MNAILTISDGTTTCDLLAAGYGLHLVDWLPAAPPLRDLDAFELPFDHGSRPRVLGYQNAVETFTLRANDATQNEMLAALRRLRRLLQQATLYWTDPARSYAPVYLSARASNETEIRYAHITGGRVESDPAPFRQPFLQPGCAAASEDLTVLVEHLLWTETPPGVDTRVWLLHPTGYDGAVESLTVDVAANLDDVWELKTSGMSSDVYDTDYLRFGYRTSDGYSFAWLRFLLDIPQGATIISAKLLMTAYRNTVQVEEGLENSLEAIYQCEQVVNATQFVVGGGGPADIFARTGRLGRSIAAEIGAWWVDQIYQSPDLSAILQEIVNQPAWAIGNAAVFRIGQGRYDADEYRTLQTANSGTPARLLVTYQVPVLAGNPYYTGVVNRFDLGELTNIYLYDQSAGTYTSVYPDADPVLHDLFPPDLAAPSLDDCTYFGIATASSDPGPFNGLWFMVKTAFAGTEYYVLWEYWNGATWATIDVVDSGEGFQHNGPTTVIWGDADTGDWAKTTVNGVLGWWVRCRPILSPMGTVTAHPTQYRFNVRTMRVPYLEIDTSAVPGDLPALARLRLTNISDNADLPNNSYSAWAAVGVRSTARGEHFCAYLNADAAHNASGITAVADTTSGFVLPTTGNRARAALYTTFDLAPDYARRLYWCIVPPYAAGYAGYFRAFLRCWMLNGIAGDIGVKLRTVIGNPATGRYRESNVVTMPGTSSWSDAFNLLDFGLLQVALPAAGAEAVQFEVHAALLGTSYTFVPALYIYDLILLPADESFVVGTMDENGLPLRYGYQLDLDSISDPHTPLTAYAHAADDNAAIYDTYVPLSAGPLELRAGARQRIWTLTARWNDGQLQGKPWLVHMGQLERQARYLTARGTS